jgi:hypothetical protein
MGWASNGKLDAKRASRAIRRLRRDGVIVYAGSLPARGKPDGTKTYGGDPVPSAMFVGATISDDDADNGRPRGSHRP